jgi:DNA-binding MarR family transcriptional regulator
MGEALKRRIRQTRFESHAQEAMLNLIVASNFIRERWEHVVRDFSITVPQYNILRILRGVYPDGHPRGEIAVRMLDRAPDVTRIIDRLEEKELVERERTNRDRRQSITRITPAGMKLLEEMDPAMKENMVTVKERLTPRDARELSRICEGLYDEVS